jgi:hypothetical protein
MADDTERILSALQNQNIAPGAKATNVIMQNQQAIVMEYVSEPYIPQEIQDLKPIETMCILKRAIGNETEWDNACNDIEYDMISLVRQIAGEETALDLALSYVHHREGLRARGMAERTAQVTQRTIEQLHTMSSADKKGLFERVGSFVRGGSKQPQHPFENQPK